MNDDEIIADGIAAFGTLTRNNTRTFGHWLRVGEGLEAGKHKLMHALGLNSLDNELGKRAYAKWLRVSGYIQVEAHARNALAKIVDVKNLSRIREWHDSLAEAQRFRINHPSTIWRGWQSSIGAKARTQPILVSMRQDSKGTIIQKVSENAVGVDINEYLWQAAMLVKFVSDREKISETEVMNRLSKLVEGHKKSPASGKPLRDAQLKA